MNDCEKNAYTSTFDGKIKTSINPLINIYLYIYIQNKKIVLFTNDFSQAISSHSHHLSRFIVCNNVWYFPLSYRIIYAADVTLESAMSQVGQCDLSFGVNKIKTGSSASKTVNYYEKQELIWLTNGYFLTYLPSVRTKKKVRSI